MDEVDRLRDESSIRAKLKLDPVPFSIILTGTSFEDPKLYDRLMPRCAGQDCGRILRGDVVKVAGKLYCDRCAVRESLVDG